MSNSILYEPFHLNISLPYLSLSVFDNISEVLRVSIFDFNYNMSYLPTVDILSLILNISNLQIDNQICIL